MYKYATVCTLGTPKKLYWVHFKREQDTWCPRSLLTALISLEISKLGTDWVAEEGRYAHQQLFYVLLCVSKSLHFYWGLSPLLSVNCLCRHGPRQNLTSLIAAVKDLQSRY